nr:MAG: hypothetical protein H1Bulk291130_000001 [Mitovirus sp.]
MGNHQLFWFGEPAEEWTARMAAQRIRLVRTIQSMAIQDKILSQPIRRLFHLSFGYYDRMAI